MTRTAAKLALALVALISGLIFTPARADYLSWHPETRRFDADVQTWSLTEVLQELTSATGWEVFLEPGTNQTVSTKFKNRAEVDALERLFGDLSFVRLAQNNGPDRLFVFRTSREGATQRIKAPARERRAAKPIADELVVTLKPGEKIEDLARELGARVIGRADGLNSYRLKFDKPEAMQEARDRLETHPNVASLDNNYWVPRPETPDLALGGSRFPTLTPKAVTDGRGVIVGLIDSAVQSRDGSAAGLLLPGLTVAGEANLPTSYPTHGTSMSETILRGLYEMSGQSDGTTVRILPVDVYGNRQSTTTFDVAYGVYQAINNGATIINLSLGSEGYSTFLHNVIRSGHSQGVLFFAAAGNEPTSTVTYPAAFPEVVAVTAEDRSGNVANYANRGDFVDVAAPGASLIRFRNRAYLVTGTSASTAFASGVAAALAERANKPLAEVEASIRQTLAVKKD